MRYLVMLLLVGCASVEHGIPAPESATAELNDRYSGQPVTLLRARYGTPDGRFIGPDGRHVLEWHTAATLRFSEPVKSTAKGTIGGPELAPWLKAVPYRQTTTSSQSYGVDYECVLQASLEPDGTVHAVGLLGQMGACQRFVP